MKTEDIIVVILAISFFASTWWLIAKMLKKPSARDTVSRTRKQTELIGRRLKK
jgi:hypothetical protein